MAQKTIPELNPISILEDNYVFPLDSGIQSYKVFWSTIKSFMWNHVINTFTELLTPSTSDLIAVELGTGGSAGEIRKVSLATLKAYLTENAGVPIGGVLGFFDFNGLLSYNTDVYTLIDGKTISDAESPLHNVTLPNATGRALIGYGTDGGSNMGSAVWTINPVGNSGHVVNISHVHGLSTGYAIIGRFGGLTDIIYAKGITISNYTANRRGRVTISGSSSTVGLETVSAGSSMTGATELGGNSGSGGSTSLNIRMRSIQVRWLLRYK